MGVNSMTCDHRCFSFSTIQIKINSQSERTFTDAKARLLTQVEARFSGHRSSNPPMVDVYHLRPTLPLSPGPAGERLGVGVGIEQQQTSSSCPAIQGRRPCVSTVESIRKKGPITGLPIVSLHRCGFFFYFFKWSTHVCTHTRN